MGNSYSVAREEQEEEEFQRLVEAVDIAQQRSAGQVDLENGLGVGYPFLGHGSLRNTIPYASPDYDRLHEHYRSIFKPSQGGPGIGLDSISARAPGSVAAPVPGPCFPETAPPAEALPPTIVGVPPAQVIVPPHTAEIPQGAAVEIPPYSGDIIWTEIDHYRHHRRATSGDLSPPPARNDWPIDMTSGVSHALMEEYALGHRSTSPASRTGSLALSASSHAPLPGAEYHQPSELHDRAESPSHSSLDQPAHDEPSPHSGTQLDHVSRLADRAEQQDRRSRSSSLKSVVARPCDSDEMLASGRSWESYKSSEQYRPPAAATSEESIVIPHHASEHSPGPQQLRMKPRSRSQSIISHHTWQRAHDAENVVHDDNDGQARRLSSTKSSISSRSHERTRARSYSRSPGRQDSMNDNRTSPQPVSSSPQVIAVPSERAERTPSPPIIQPQPILIMAPYPSAAPLPIACYSVDARSRRSRSRSRSPRRLRSETRTSPIPTGSIPQVILVHSLGSSDSEDFIPPRPSSTSSRSSSPSPIIIRPPIVQPAFPRMPSQPHMAIPSFELHEQLRRTEHIAKPPSVPEPYEQLLQMHERSLANWEQQARLWHEQSMQFGRIMQGLEKHLLILRHGGMASMDSVTSDIEGKDGKGTMADQVQTLSYSAPVPKRPYPSRPYAVELRAVRRFSDDWSPPWKVFPLKAFRGSSYTFLKIQAHWDDADLLRELSRSYDKLRTVWRKWFSLRSVRSITMVYADHTCVYPRRVGPAGVSPSKNMRLRYFLRHPDQMKGRHEFMQVLTAHTDYGIEFVEGWQLTRIAVAILLPVVASLILGVVYSILENDVSSAFTVAGYMTSAYSVCLVLLGLLNFVEF